MLPMCELVLSDEWTDLEHDLLPVAEPVGRDADTIDKIESAYGILVPSLFRLSGVGIGWSFTTVARRASPSDRISKSLIISRSWKAAEIPTSIQPH